MMLTQAQIKKFDKIKLDVEDLLDSDTTANEVLKQVVQYGAPILIGFMQGKTPSLQSLQSIATNILAVVMASTQDGGSSISPLPKLPNYNNTTQENISKEG